MNNSLHYKVLILLQKELLLCRKHIKRATYMGCPEIFRTFKIARHCVDLAGRGKCSSLVMSLTNCVAKTALPYLA